MGMDLYAGTLTRYYARNWKTSTQQWAEENGYTYNRIGPNGPMEQEEKPDPEEVRSSMEEWRDSILAVLKNSGVESPSWPESNEAPYYTDKPDWDAWLALILTAACAVTGETVPPTVEKGWGDDLWDLPVIQKARERKWSLFLGAELWLPFPDRFCFDCPNPLGNPVTIGTIGGILNELEELNGLLWQAGEEEILSWTTTEGYPPDGEIGPDGKMHRIGEHTVYDTRSLAKFAYSILYRAARFSQENQVPILLDY